MPPNSQLTAHCLCSQSLLRTKLDWHSSLISGFLLAAKILNDERVFASDARIIASHNSTSQDLIVLEQRAFAVLLPSMGGIHGRALIFRVALLNLALDSNPAPQQVVQGHVHILVAQSDAALLSEQTALAESTAPNATVQKPSRAGSPLGQVPALVLGLVGNPPPTRPSTSAGTWPSGEQ